MQRVAPDAEKTEVILPAKCGFVQEGLMRQRVYKKGEYIDIIPVSIINEND